MAARTQGAEVDPIVLTAAADHPVVNYLPDFLDAAERASYEEAFKGLPPHDSAEDAEGEDEQAVG